MVGTSPSGQTTSDDYGIPTCNSNNVTPYTLKRAFPNTTLWKQTQQFDHFATEMLDSACVTQCELQSIKLYLFNLQTRLYISWPTFAYESNQKYIETFISEFYCSFAACTCLWLYKISKGVWNMVFKSQTGPTFSYKISRMHGRLCKFFHRNALSMQFLEQSL